MKSTLQSKYKGLISVLEVGANNGFFSLSLARDFKATCVMVDTTDRLADICSLNTEYSNQLFYLKKALTYEDLKKMSKDMYFDVAIATYVLHHIPEWRKFKDNMFKITEIVIIETPPSHDSRLEIKSNIPTIESEMFHLKGTVIATTPRPVAEFNSDLKVMECNANLSSPLLDGVSSNMFAFNTKCQIKNIAFKAIDKANLTNLNLSFPR